MIDESSFSFLVLVILIALAFDFANGFNDAANAIATVVSTRVMSPLVAVLMAATMNFLGALSGTAVAKAVGKGVVDPDAVTLVVVAGGVSAAAIWVFVATRFGMPVSGSHSLIAGVGGAGVAHASWGVLVGPGIRKIVLGLMFSPLLGFLGGYIVMLSIYWIFRRVSPARITAVFGKLQIGTAAAMAFSHGSNDAQKTMGVITLALAVHYQWADTGRAFEVPFWVIVASAGVMAAGTYLGGYRVIRTLGVRIVKMRPVHGFFRRKLRRQRHRAGVANRDSRQHHSRHHLIHPGDGVHPPPVGRALGRGQRHHLRLGPDVSGLRTSRRGPVLPDQADNIAAARFGEAWAFLPETLATVRS